MSRSSPTTPPPDVRVPPSRSSKNSRRRKVQQPGWVAFGTYLDGLIRRRGLTVGEFAEAVGYDRTMVSKVLTGYVGVPVCALTGINPKDGKPHRRKLWADALGLGQAESKAFTDEGWLSLAPQPVIDRLRRLDNEVAWFKARVDRSSVKEARTKPRERRLSPDN